VLLPSHTWLKTEICREKGIARYMIVKRAKKKFYILVPRRFMDKCMRNMILANMQDAKVMNME
jgi:hypothetical protein